MDFLNSERFRHGNKCINRRNNRTLKVELLQNSNHLYIICYIHRVKGVWAWIPAIKMNISIEELLFCASIIAHKL